MKFFTFQKLRVSAKAGISSFLILLAFVFASCSETSEEDNEFSDWKNRNESYFNGLYEQAKAAVSSGSSEWKVLTKWSLNDNVATAAANHVVVKVLEAGTGSGCPLFTDSVRVHYRGNLMPSASYPSGYQFDSSWTGDYNIHTAKPTEFCLSGQIIDGFATALLNMHIGDRWLVYIPYQLGYGVNGSGTIPGYSTLVFDITLVGYYRVGQALPDWKAKQQPQWCWIEE